MCNIKKIEEYAWPHNFDGFRELVLTTSVHPLNAKSGTISSQAMVLQPFTTSSIAVNKGRDILCTSEPLSFDESIQECQVNEYELKTGASLIIPVLKEDNSIGDLWQNRS